MNPIINLLGIILLTIAVQFAAFTWVNFIQRTQLSQPLSTVGWNK